MQVRAALMLVVSLGAAVAAAAGCGEQFTLGSSGSGGSGGAGGASTTSATGAVATSSSPSSSSASSSGTMTSTGAAPPPGSCSMAFPNCGPDAYCFVQDCGTGEGTCQPLPSFNKGGLSPLCGCDGNTYWSGVEAIAAQQAIGSMSECGSTAHTCSFGVSCSGGANCSLRTDNCADTNPPGKCWVLPSSCTGHIEGARACAGSVLGDGGIPCTSMCNLIKDHVIYTRQPACP